MSVKFTTTINLPESMIRNVTGAHAQRGSAWLRELPSLVETHCRLWKLSEVKAFSNLSYNYVASALRDDSEQVVLKLGVPTKELLTEIEALSLYEGKGVITLLASDPKNGALLLEQVTPGEPLASVKDDVEATSIAIAMMKRIRRPLPRTHNLPSLQEWGRSLLNTLPGTTPLPDSTLQSAEDLFQELLSSSPVPVVLHGDLHHDNILKAQREPWLVIDPKGLAGDPAYEVGTFLLNPSERMKQADFKQTLTCRIDQLTAELGFERSRMIGWGIVQAMLSACWTISDGGVDWKKNVECAEHLLALRKS